MMMEDWYIEHGKRAGKVLLLLLLPQRAEGRGQTRWTLLLRTMYRSDVVTNISPPAEASPRHPFWLQLVRDIVLFQPLLERLQPSGLT